MPATLILLFTGLAPAAVLDIQVDPLTSSEDWRVGGNRINYTLGSSTLQAVAEPPREGFDRRVRMYVDGKLVVDRPFDEGAMLFAETPLRLGVGTLGAIDEVILYPRALTPEEVIQLAR
jgi:hypothetical protein